MQILAVLVNPFPKQKLLVHIPTLFHKNLTKPLFVLQTHEQIAIDHVLEVFEVHQLKQSLLTFGVTIDQLPYGRSQYWIFGLPGKVTQFLHQDLL